MIKIIECPRDAMQGLNDFIPTEKKIKYINQLLRVGFDAIDFGSFVSPKAIPQMRDTAEVLKGLDLNTLETKSKLLAIVANERGAKDAISFKAVDFLGFPLSLSETFQKRNTNQSISDALNLVNELVNLCLKSSKEMVVYLSMGFGNPYNDPYEPEIVLKFADVLKSIGIRIISLADTIGSALPNDISYLFGKISSAYPDLEIGVHLHSNSITAKEKVCAALNAGCKRIDGALLGFGGCPMADDKLVGNIDTRIILDVLNERNAGIQINQEELIRALPLANEIFMGS